MAYPYNQSSSGGRLLEVVSFSYRGNPILGTHLLSQCQYRSPIPKLKLIPRSNVGIIEQPTNRNVPIAAKKAMPSAYHIAILKLVILGSESKCTRRLEMDGRFVIYIEPGYVRSAEDGPH
jgi:hypothetical protein